MFTGHFAPALALYARKDGQPRAPLWALFLAAQLPDLVYFPLLLAGVEKATYDPSQTGMLRWHLESIPYSHSLVTNAVFALALVGVGGKLKRPEAGVALGLAALSHWFLDALVHAPDVPVDAAGATKVGLGLWAWPLAELAVEVGLVVAAWAWATRRRPLGRGGLALGTALVVVQLLNALVIPLPETTESVAADALASYGAFAALAWAVTRTRA